MSRFRSNKKFMVIKIDFENAYDHLRWDFIASTLDVVSFPLVIHSIIFQCICTPRVQVL